MAMEAAYAPQGLISTEYTRQRPREGMTGTHDHPPAYQRISSHLMWLLSLGLEPY
jgi:hypothetical protein